jgi:hypothetical protein
MKPPKFTDRRGRYRSAAESRTPGYLARRFEAYRRLQERKARCTVTPIKKVAP